MRWVWAIALGDAAFAATGRTVREARIPGRELHPAERMAPRQGPWTGGPIDP